MNKELILQWTIISDPQKYVSDVLVAEAGDIPAEKINQGPWFVDTVTLRDITIDRRMIGEHDLDPVHIARRDDVIASIRAGHEIKPLIALGEELFLVDGYARYRALQKLRVERVQVLRQRMTKK